MLNTLLRPLFFALFLLWVLSDRDVYPLYFSLCNLTSIQSMAVLTIHIMLVARLGIKAFLSVLYPDWLILNCILFAPFSYSIILILPAPDYLGHVAHFKHDNKTF